MCRLQLFCCLAFLFNLLRVYQLIKLLYRVFARLLYATIAQLRNRRFIYDHLVQLFRRGYLFQLAVLRIGQAYKSRTQVHPPFIQVVTLM